MTDHRQCTGQPLLNLNTDHHRTHYQTSNRQNLRDCASLCSSRRFAVCFVGSAGSRGQQYNGAGMGVGPRGGRPRGIQSFVIVMASNVDDACALPVVLARVLSETPHKSAHLPH